ncbi:MAG: DUF2125 domain-containing protein, partial [Parvularcula sp.]|nr:DUF2125 domain-containing protein [Parvularcula sp.]
MAERRASRRLILVPIIGFVVIFAVYAFMWRSGAEAVRNELARFAAQEAEQGRSLTYDDVRTEGFPLNLRGTVENVVWQDPERGTFRAENVLIAAVPYNPERIILAPRGEQSITFGETVYDLQSDDLRFNLERDFLAVEGANITLTSDNSKIAVASLIAYNQFLEGARTIALTFRNALYSADTEVVMPFFDLAGSDDGETLNVAAFRLGVGPAGASAPTTLSGEGQLRYDPQGQAQGEFELKFRNEGPALDVLADLGGMERD